MTTRIWKVYGAQGHRQRTSFEPSFIYDWSNENQTKIVEIENADKTGTNEYSIIKITTDSAADCEKEFFAQLSDGIFENSRVGKFEELRW